MSSRVIPGLGDAASKQKASRRHKQRQTSGSSPTTTINNTTISPTTGIDSYSSANTAAAVSGANTLEIAIPDSNSSRSFSEPSVDAKLAAFDDEFGVEPVPKEYSANLAIQKKIRAAVKKLQRISSYESAKESLNQDQIRAVASKPVIEASLKELQELAKIVETEQAAHAEQVKIATAKRNHRIKDHLEVSVQAAKDSAQSDLVFLLQFFHLHSLFKQEEDQQEHVTVNPVAANASREQVNAVKSLYESLVNGPLLSGPDDATQRIQKLVSSSEEAFSGSVSYSEIQKLVLGMLDPPAAVDAADVDGNDTTGVEGNDVEEIHNNTTDGPLSPSAAGYVMIESTGVSYSARNGDHLLSTSSQHVNGGVDETGAGGAAAQQSIPREFNFLQKSELEQETLVLGEGPMEDVEDAADESKRNWADETIVISSDEPQAVTGEADEAQQQQGKGQTTSTTQGSTSEKTSSQQKRESGSGRRGRGGGRNRGRNNNNNNNGNGQNQQGQQQGSAPMIDSEGFQQQARRKPSSGNQRGGASGSGGASGGASGGSGFRGGRGQGGQGRNREGQGQSQGQGQGQRGGGRGRGGHRDGGRAGAENHGAAAGGNAVAAA